MNFKNITLSIMFVLTCTSIAKANDNTPIGTWEFPEFTYPGTSGSVIVQMKIKPQQVTITSRCSFNGMMTVVRAVAPIEISENSLRVVSPAMNEFRTQNSESYMICRAIFNSGTFSYQVSDNNMRIHIPKLGEGLLLDYHSTMATRIIE